MERDRTCYSRLAASISGPHPLTKILQDQCLTDQQKNDAWIDALVKIGVKLAHPDDGWVDRVRNILNPCYPQFRNGTVGRGNLIALGRFDKFRIVRVTEVIPPSKWDLSGTCSYRFKEIKPTAPAPISRGANATKPNPAKQSEGEGS